MLRQQNRKFWNSRAAIGQKAGTDDFVLKQLKLDLILRRIPRGVSMLDVGCGNGETLVRLASQNGCTGTGIDFSSEIIAVATAGAKAANCHDRLSFREAYLPSLPQDIGEFDDALSERCFINLADANEQHNAFEGIMSHLKPGGHFLMIESFIQGLHKSNELRRRLDLEPIDPLWHNCSLDEEIVSTWANKDFILEETLPFTSTYHFLSRVIYARLAADSGKVLRYDSDINKLALKLPGIGDLGPVRLWLWR